MRQKIKLSSRNNYISEYDIVDIWKGIGFSKYIAKEWLFYIGELLMKYYYSSDTKYKDKVIYMPDKIAALEKKPAVNMSKIE